MKCIMPRAERSILIAIYFSNWKSKQRENISLFTEVVENWTKSTEFDYQYHDFRIDFTIFNVPVSLNVK